MSQKDRSTELLGEFLETCKIIGPDKTKEAIIEARKDQRHQKKLIENMIVSELCKQFRISKEKLMHGKTKGKRTDALMVGYVLAKKHLEYNLYEIESFFGKDYSNISKAITMYNHFSKDNKTEAIIIDKYEKISEVIIHFKTVNQHGQKDVN